MSMWMLSAGGAGFILGVKCIVTNVCTHPFELLMQRADV